MRSASSRNARRAPASAGALVGWALAAALAGCNGGNGSADVLDDSAYVEVMSELASLGWRFGSPRDSLARDSARFATLRKHGLALEDLERFADRRASDPQSMAELWELIGARADELASQADRQSDEQLLTPDSTGMRRR